MTCLVYRLQLWARSVRTFGKPVDQLPSQYILNGSGRLFVHTMGCTVREPTFYLASLVRTCYILVSTLPVKPCSKVLGVPETS
jgi:hypothetical protein